MKFIELPLTNGENIMFVIGNSQNFVISPGIDSQNQSILADGIHNNGGWRIAMGYNQLVSKLQKELV